jgi:hypothetical protein
MASQLADYEITGPALDERVLPCLPARCPSRLGSGVATLWVLGPLARVPIEPARARLEAVAAVRSENVPAWLETGTGEFADRQVVWVSASTEVVGTLASPTADMGVPDKLRALAAAARAAHDLHERGQLHGAICPQAIALRPGGAGAVLGPPSLADGKQPVAHVGYPPLGYADPQLLRGEGGRWSDIWGLGATLRQVLTGSPPFQGIEELPVVQGLATLLAAPSVGPGAPPGQLAGLVNACLSTDPLDRPATAKDVAEQLEGAASQW